MDIFLCIIVCCIPMFSTARPAGFDECKLIAVLLTQTENKLYLRAGVLHGGGWVLPKW